MGIYLIAFLSTFTFLIASFVISMHEIFITSDHLNSRELFLSEFLLTNLKLKMKLDVRIKLCRNHYVH